MNADVAWLKELYGSQGYVFADIKAEPIFLEEQGKLKLMYHIDEGKRWRVGNIYVHIAGDNPHTKIQTALNRLSFRSGEIADIREIRASERRLQASGLFMADPVHGVMPKITYHIPEVGKTEMAKGDSGGFRGQSPDGRSPERSRTAAGARSTGRCAKHDSASRPAAHRAAAITPRGADSTAAANHVQGRNAARLRSERRAGRRAHVHREH